MVVLLLKMKRTSRCALDEGFWRSYIEEIYLPVTGMSAFDVSSRVFLLRWTLGGPNSPPFRPGATYIPPPRLGVNPKKHRDEAFFFVLACLDLLLWGTMRCGRDHACRRRSGYREGWDGLLRYWRECGLIWHLDRLIFPAWFWCGDDI